MRLLTFRSDNTLKLGIATSSGIMDVAIAAQKLNIAHIPITPDTFYKAGMAALESLSALVSETEGKTDLFMAEETLTLGPCVPNPGKILCVGLNYRKHAKESGMELPSTPVLFSKFNNSIAAPNEAIPLPENAVQYDYEAELVVVIGKQAKYVAEENALDYILGYCNGNDISARDLQMLTGQWMLGKTLDKFLPIGPYVVTVDEADAPQMMDVKCWYNDEQRQNSNTSDMIFSVAEVVSYASQYMTLNPGDIISTGTPEGVILGMNPKNWMKPGDEITIEIGNLGRLTNKMAAED